MFGDKEKDKEKDKDRGKERVGRAEAGAAREAAEPGKGATLIASNTRIEGDVHFSDQLLVNGEVRGNILADGESDAGLTVSAKGVVHGEIRVPNVVINGRVQGDVHAGKHIELAADARVEGNVHYHLIEMVMGARVDGSLVYTPQGGEVRGGARSESGRSGRNGGNGRSGPDPAEAEGAAAADPAQSPTAKVGKGGGGAP